MATGLLVLAVVGGLATQALVGAARSRAWDVAQDRPLDGSIALAVERRVPAGPVTIEFRPVSPDITRGFYGIDQWGVAFVLLSAGRRPGLDGSFDGPPVGLVVPPGSRWPVVTVSVDPATKSVTGVTVGHRTGRGARPAGTRALRAPPAPVRPGR